MDREKIKSEVHEVRDHLGLVGVAGIKLREEFERGVPVFDVELNKGLAVGDVEELLEEELGVSVKVVEKDRVDDGLSGSFANQFTEVLTSSNKVDIESESGVRDDEEE